MQAALHCQLQICTCVRTQIAPGGGNAGPNQRLLQWQASKQKERQRQANLEHAAAAAHSQWLQAASLARSAYVQGTELKGQGFAGVVTAARQESVKWHVHDAGGALEWWPSGDCIAEHVVHSFLTSIMSSWASTCSSLYAQTVAGNALLITSSMARGKKDNKGTKARGMP
eukprot:1143013-Pelagomonas_calceolata.AAC.3